jgi:hypothetical protein
MVRCTLLIRIKIYTVTIYSAKQLGKNSGSYLQTTFCNRFYFPISGHNLLPVHGK